MNPSAARTPARTAELSVRFGAMEGSSRAGQLTVWEGDTGKENVGQGVRSEKRKRESSSYLGVSWVERLGKYRARYSSVYLGCFDDEVEAAEAYNAKARELKGEKAKLNVVDPDEKAASEARLAAKAAEAEAQYEREVEEYKRKLAAYKAAEAEAKEEYERELAAYKAAEAEAKEEYARELAAYKAAEAAEAEAEAKARNLRLFAGYKAAEAKAKAKAEAKQAKQAAKAEEKKLAAENFATPVVSELQAMQRQADSSAPKLLERHQTLASECASLKPEESITPHVSLQDFSGAGVAYQLNINVSHTMRTANGDLVWVGAQLCIFGLESQVELNDVLCTAVALDPDAGRVEVTLEDGKSARVRPSNLRAKYEACDLVRRGAKPPLS